MFFTRDAYEQFCREQYPRIVNYLIKKWKIKNEDSEDIAQQIFYDHIRAMDKWSHDTHDPEEAVKYLFAITKNHARKAWGKHYIIPNSVSLDESEHTETGEHLEEPLDGYSEYFEKERRKKAFQAIEQLEPVERDVVLLYAYGKKHAEICELYGWNSPGNVTRVLKKAFEKLVNIIENEYRSG